MAQMSASDRKSVDFLRAALAEGCVRLPPAYATDFNLLRWLQGYDYDAPSTVDNLRRHATFRDVFDLNVDLVDGAHTPDFAQYFPMHWVGGAGRDDKFVVVERTGVIDVAGLMKSFRSFANLQYRLQLLEHWLRLLMQHERQHGRQAHFIFVMDMTAIKLDPSLISTITGPYAAVLRHLEFNYPEMISRILIINTPSFMPYLWKLAKPFVNGRTASKIEILSDASDWLRQAELMFEPDLLPRPWGGRTREDPQFHHFVHRHDWAVPSTLQIRDDSLLNDTLTVKAGCEGTIDCELVDSVGSQKVIFLLLFCTTDSMHSLYGLEIQYQQYNDAHATPSDKTDYETLCPFAEYPTLHHPDAMRIRIPGPGRYRIRVTNFKRWFASIQFLYHLRFVDTENNSVQFDTVTED